MDSRRHRGDSLVKIFVEGGGNRKKTVAVCKRGFSALIGRVARSSPRIVPCGPRGMALDKFRNALHNGEDALLLVDSESPVRPQNFGRPWAHLAESDNWQKPDGATDDDAHLMAQCMESWFVADPDALAAHFGDGFKPAKLPGNPDVEEIAKTDVLAGLESATKKIRNGEYEKTRDGFALIGKIDPSRVAKRAPHAERFFDALRRQFGAQDESEKQE